MRLTDIAVKNAKPADKQIKLSDGKGLYLLVHPNGSKYWQAAYRFDGKQKVFSIGTYPTVSLAKDAIFELDYVFLDIKPNAILLIDIVAIDAIITTTRQ